MKNKSLLKYVFFFRKKIIMLLNIQYTFIEIFFVKILEMERNVRYVFSEMGHLQIFRNKYLLN